MFSQESVRLTKALGKQQARDQGIYFTPPTIVDYVYNLLKPNPGARILEPSAGSGEFLRTFRVTDAYELNEECANSLKTHFPHTNVYSQDFLTSTPQECYDFIVGNPPFFTMKRDLVPSEYKDFITGRPNAYTLFVLKCLSLLRPDTGVLSFVLPTPFLNSSYYDKVRRHIYNHTEIIELAQIPANFLQTKQPVVVLTLRNKKPEQKNKYCFDHGGILSFTVHADRLKALVANTKTLAQLGLTARVGNIVWNEHKDALNESNGVPIVYPSDLSAGTIDPYKLVLNTRNSQKKRFVEISTKVPFKNPGLVISRGYGNGSFRVRCAIVNTDREYFVENHLLFVQGPIDTLKKIQHSLEKSSEFSDLYFSNAAINIHEINHILPVST